MNPTTPEFSNNVADSAGRILVLEPDENVTWEITRALRDAAPGAQVRLANSLSEAQRLVANMHPDLFVLDVDASPDAAQEFLLDLRTSHPHARAIILTEKHLAAHREQAAGLGAIHFLEKPFPHSDFIDLVGALLSPSSKPEAEKFQGTLSDLHIADIIQLKCMSGSTSALEFTGPKGEKARVYFEAGQVRHAIAPGKRGVAAFNEIVKWKGGRISEVIDAEQSPKTIDMDWQLLMMEAVRKMDETAGEENASPHASVLHRKILVIDDSMMLLSFVSEILDEAGYDVSKAGTAEEGLSAAVAVSPALILLDFVLPDMKGDEVVARLSQNSDTAKIPVVYMSGFGSDLRPDQVKNPNVIGSLNKPFTSDLLLETVERYMPKEPSEAENIPTPEPTAPDRGDGMSWSSAEIPVGQVGVVPEISAAPFQVEAAAPTESHEDEVATAVSGGENDAWWSAPVSASPWQELPTPPIAEPTAEASSPLPAERVSEFISTQIATEPAAIVPATPAEPLPTVGNTFFSGDTSFFSLNWALHTISKQKLTGILRCFWDKESVDLLARNGDILLATTKDPELYCPEAPITLVNVDAAETARARDRQRENGCPLFITLARDGLILKEPSLQLVQHYGQKLFAQLWSAPRVRFVFELEQNLPDYANDAAPENDVDHWALSTLRFIQFQDLVDKPETDSNSIPAYTRDGFERVQKLRLTVAEAQFASQFNGVRSLAQIAKNLRLDFKFAKLTMFRFLALEIVECWPETTATKSEKRGLFQRFGRSIGLGE